MYYVDKSIYVQDINTKDKYCCHFMRITGDENLSAFQKARLFNDGSDRNFDNNQKISVT